MMKAFRSLFVAAIVIGTTLVFVKHATQPASANAGTANAEVEKTVKIEKEWRVSSDKAKDNNLWKMAPKDGVIADPKLWAKIWKAWNGERMAPKVDFEKELVLVAACSAGRLNKISIVDLKLSHTGDLKFRYFMTQADGDGFVAAMWKIKRSGIKTVNGKKIAAKPMIR